MPTETRRISFNSDELVEALVDYDKQADQKLTCGVVGSVSIDHDPDMRVAVDVKLHDEAKSMLINLNPKYLSAALLVFCVQRRIPVPQNPVRYLKKVGENIALCFGGNEVIDGSLNIQVECL